MMWIWRLQRRLRRWIGRVEWQTCSRRIGEVGPWHRDEGCDRWERDSWSRLRQWSDGLRDARSRLYDRIGWKGNRFYGGTYWPEGFDPPRTCSFCGSVHPEDAITLLQAGWEVECTGKSYKRYLQPPGYRTAIDTTRQQIRERGQYRWAGPRSPVPPVKLYVQHMTQQDIDRFNEALRTTTGA